MNLQNMKKLLKKLFCLPPVPTLLISIPAYIFVIYTLAAEDVNMVVAYVSYFLSAYALIITVMGITGIVRFVRKGIDNHPFVRKALGIPVVSRYLKEDMFRAETALYQGFFINLLYAGIKMFSGILYKSVWFITLAVYYILLAIMRASLLHYVRKTERNFQSYVLKPIPKLEEVSKQEKPKQERYGDEKGKNKISEWKRYRLCGIILLFMNVALAGIVILVVHENSGFEYPGMLIYVMAMYAFYAAITAVWNVVKFRRYGSPVMSAAKVINLTAALVSMLSLETAMLTQFGAADNPMFRKVMTASTGAGISIIVLGMAVFMIGHSTKQLNKIKYK